MMLWLAQGTNNLMPIIDELDFFWFKWFVINNLPLFIIPISYLWMGQGK
jgi:hypothetical protein